MARIAGTPTPTAMTRLVARMMPRGMKKLAGRLPQRDDGLGALMIWAYKPKLMAAMGKYNQAVRKPGEVGDDIRNLVELKGATMIGCEYCIDLGSQICRHSGISDEKIVALVDYQSSPLFDDREKAALDFTVAVMRTPVAMTDEIFARAQRYFSDPQLVEITALLTLVNLDRFNAAFGIGAAGFSEGMVCAVPARA